VTLRTHWRCDEPDEPGRLDAVTRKLILIRHAKAADGPVDVERPLASRGWRDAGAVGRLLARDGIAPDRVVLSPARRAQQTWEGAQEELPTRVGSVVDARVYDNEVDRLFEVIRDTPTDIDQLALVGHNPSFQELAHSLDDGTGDEQARQALLDGYPTSGVAIFDVTDQWADLQPHSATLTSFSAPRAE
jgi:phosphohistidine phosphatase